MAAALVFVGVGCGPKVPFKTVWQTKLDHSAEISTYCNNDGSRVLGTNTKEATVLDGATGKPVWTGEFKKISAALKKTTEQYTMWDAKCIFLFQKKLGKDKMSVVDLETGKELWNSEKYQDVTTEAIVYIPEMDAFAISLKKSLVMIKARTGEELWQTDVFSGAVAMHAYLADKKQVVLVNWKTGLAALFSGFKSQIMCLNVENGDVVWEADYHGIIKKKIVTGDWLSSLSVVGDKVFLTLDGLQVYNLADGKKLWQVQLGLDGNKSGFFTGNKHIYNAISDPLITETAVYISTLDKKVQKYDKNTGEKLWELKLEKVKYIPNLAFTNGMVIAQRGGQINIQQIKTVRRQSGDYVYYETIRTSEWKWEGPFGLTAIDDASGKQVWLSEKFSGGVTEIVSDNENIYCCGAKDFYCFNAKDGKEKYQIAHAPAKVGKARWTVNHGDMVVAVSEKGVAAYKKADGKLAWSTLKCPKISDWFFQGENFFVKNTKARQIAGVDLATGKVKGILTYKGGAKGDYDLTEDGNFIYYFEGKKVTKLQTN
jgi:outer membrane protein assembly factor BamB